MSTFHDDLQLPTPGKSAYRGAGALLAADRYPEDPQIRS
ncbi:hypothetical Protein YC6258_04071 [Gynuella sunshinyii YC6258]|uniref:Uncharacterized protein n=1 Tax=Gynuella sunshinyii YC6258 TaxID=1445510 RepID=A0A0C5VN07_9GAMM|nr:hypothetical Protein YC6258_04071 [Gynuella sunshinyii YC6258]